VSIWADVRAWATAALMASALFAAGAAAQSAPASGPAQAPPPPETVPVALDVAGRITIGVFVNGQGPFDFMIDTGANRSAVSRALADRLALQALRIEPVHTFTGLVTAPIVRVATLRAGDSVSVRDASLPVLEGGVLAGASGILGADSLIGRRMIMDMRRRIVSIEAAGSTLGGRWLSLPAQLRHGNLVIARGTVLGEPTHVIIDTGSQRSFANSALLTAIRARRNDLEPTIGTRIISAGRPMVIQNLLFLPKVVVGDLDIMNVSAFVGDLYIFQLWGVMDEPALVLGMDVWGELDALAIDYRRGRVHVRI
jgi:predicted aspartyl protease